MHKLLQAGTGGLMALVSIAPAWSQSTSASEGSGLELAEVVVTAEKANLNLQKTPVSIQIYKGDTLRKEGKKRIDEIMSGVVGVTTQSDNGGSMIFYFRGLNTGLAAAPGVSNPGGSATVSSPAMPASPIW